MVKMVKKIAISVLFLAELGVFTWTYVFGLHGLKNIWQVCHENGLLEQRIARAALENDVLEQELVAWDEHAFYKEKVAREQLQMAHENEVIYYIR